MNKEQYHLTENPNHMEFEFFSNGPNGKIKKGIKYTLMFAGEVAFYNLAFGDIDEQTGTMDDLSNSNNADRDKVLATVAATVVMFLERFPNSAIHATGSTLSRTRLYQIGIASNFEYISKLLDVYGLLDGKLLRFKKNVNYEAFVVYLIK